MVVVRRGACVYKGGLTRASADRQASKFEEDGRVEEVPEDQMFLPHYFEELRGLEATKAELQDASNKATFQEMTSEERQAAISLLMTRLKDFDTVHFTDYSWET